MMAELSVVLGKINPSLGELWGLQLWIFLLVVASTAVFLLGYAVQGARIGLQLGIALGRIRNLQRAGKSVPPAAMAAVFRTSPLDHLWSEYSDSLHELKRTGNGGGTPSEIRATLPAETFFTREVLVDSRLFDDFTRHLPGVLTGLGIIGTFAGLLDGLSRFDATSSITAVAGLKPLLSGVAHAFTVSAIAIGCAMLVVFISKFALAVFYGQVATLDQLIDASYATGAGEEYLSRLVFSSEQAGVQAAQLQKVMVQDLARILNETLERHFARQAAVTDTRNGRERELRDAMLQLTAAVNELRAALPGARRN